MKIRIEYGTANNSDSDYDRDIVRNADGTPAVLWTGACSPDVARNRAMRLSALRRAELIRRGLRARVN